MGVGKTIVSKELADELNLCFYDLDEMIEKQSKLKIPFIFEKFGEERFRKIENNVLKEIVSRKDKFVLALGGGTLGNSKNLKIIEQTGNLIFLENDFEELWKRIKLSERPLVKRGKGYCQKLFLERQNIYSKSSLTIICKQKTILEIVQELTTKIKMLSTQK